MIDTGDVCPTRREVPVENVGQAAEGVFCVQAGDDVQVGEKGTPAHIVFIVRGEPEAQLYRVKSRAGITASVPAGFCLYHLVNKAITVTRIKGCVCCCLFTTEMVQDVRSSYFSR